MSWLWQAVHKSLTPKQSIIEVLKHQLGGMQPGRSMVALHASDVTKTSFCPRRWAFFDILDKDPAPMFVSMALDVTFRMGRETERLLIEEWAGEAVVGNWRCRHCGTQRSMTTKPAGRCSTVHPTDWRLHDWAHISTQVTSSVYDIQGEIDALFNIGAPQLIITEVKILNPDDFEKILTPLPEHRLRTNLYMKLMEQSSHAHKEKINVQEARVLYISRGYGKHNPDWDEILPFKEFVVKRNDADLHEFLERAKLLKNFRDHQLMPSGICATALDKTAKACSVCSQCFSGQYPAGKQVVLP